MAELFTTIPSTVLLPLITPSPFSYKPTSNNSANSLSRPAQAGDLNIIQFAPLSRLEIAQGDRTDGHAKQAQRRMTQGRGHPADLPVLSLAQGDLDPGRRDGFAEPDGDRTLREIGRQGKQLDLRRPRAPTAEEDPATKTGQGLFVGNALDLDQVDFGKLVPGVRDVVRQRTVRGEEQESFRVVVQPPRRIDVRDRDVARQRGTPRRIREAREHTIRFVERQRPTPGHGFAGAVRRITSM